MENKLIDFPKNINNALVELSREYKLGLFKETHYEAIDRELRFFKRSNIFRLNLNFNSGDNFVSVTFLNDQFPLPFSKIFEWLHNYIPFFSYCAKTSWKKLSNLPLGLNQEEYKEIIKKVIQDNIRIRINEINK